MRQHRVGAVVLLGAAALLLTPTTGSAQVRFGMGGYGGYYGYSPVYSSYGYAPYAWGGYSNYGYYPGYGTYGAWSYPSTSWGNYNYQGTAWGNYNYPSYATNNYYNGPTNTADAGSYSYGAPAQAKDAVLLNVRVPDPNAEVWVEGKRTEQRGTSREFISPPLNPDKNYTYEVRARWTENGKEKERTQTVAVRANRSATVDFTVASNSRVDDIDRDRSKTDVDKERRGTKSPDNPPPD